MPEHRGVRLLDGDFILVELLERPPARLALLDDGSQGDAQLLEEAVSQASSSSEDEYQGPAIYVVHRPRFRTTDSRVCWIASDTRSTINELLIERHWPDLRNNEYYTLAIHKSLQRDMPDAPQIQHQIILPDADFLPRPQVRGVLVYLRIDKVQDLYAVPLATRTSAYGLYYWAGILPFCQQTPTQCGAWINGERIYGAAPARLTHADYVKIAFWQPGTQPAELQPIALQEYDPIHATYSEGSPYRTAGSNTSDEDTALMPTGSPAPMDTVPLGDLYWMCRDLCLSWRAPTITMSVWTTTPCHQATSQQESPSRCYMVLHWATPIAPCPTCCYDDATQPSSTWTVTKCAATTQSAPSSREYIG